MYYTATIKNKGGKKFNVNVIAETYEHAYKELKEKYNEDKYEILLVSRYLFLEADKFVPKLWW